MHFSQMSATPTGGVTFISQHQEIVTGVAATSWSHPAQDPANQVLRSAQIQTTRIYACFLAGDDFHALVSLVLYPYLLEDFDPCLHVSRADQRSAWRGHSFGHFLRETPRLYTSKHRRQGNCENMRHCTSTARTLWFVETSYDLYCKCLTAEGEEIKRRGTARLYEIILLRIENILIYCVSCMCRSSLSSSWCSWRFWPAAWVASVWWCPPGARPVCG